MRRWLVAAGVACAVALSSDATRAGAEKSLDKYRSLLQEKRALLRENAILKHEAQIASTKSPYILFHLTDGKLEFRVRGKSFKSYSFSRLSVDGPGRRAADVEAVYKALDGPLTVLEVQGAHPELIPPDPNAGVEAGLIYSNAEHLASQTGAAPVRSDAGVLGVDVPTDYYIRFEQNVVFHIGTEKDLSFRAKATDRLSRIAEAMRSTLATWWRPKEVARQSKPRFELYLTTDADTAKNLHYSLLPGEQIFPVPPPPPPIVLIATGGKGAAAGEALEASQ